MNRPGPGRPKGYPRTGGAKKGSAQRLKASDVRVGATGVAQTPLQIMIEHMQSLPEGSDERFQAATQVAPYIHARLSSATVKTENALERLSVAELDILLTAARALAAASGGTAEATEETDNRSELH